MYLRTTKRRNKDGSTVEYYHLAHNERSGGGGVSVPKIIHNFGRADELDRDELVRLCRSIARVCGLEVRDPLAEGQIEPAGGEWLPEGVEFLGAVELGATLVAEALWERLGVGPALRRVCRQRGCQVPYERALLSLTANRLAEPSTACASAATSSASIPRKPGARRGAGPRW